jgi:hypothetical protein
LANIGIKPGDKVLEKGIARIQKLVDELRRDLSTEVTQRKAGTGTILSATHEEEHIISSHTDTTASGTQLDTLVGGGDADGLHIHSSGGSHTIESHTGTSATGAELDNLTDGTNADSLHSHTTALEGHTIAFHSDTTATGTELNTLTGGSATDASALHSHTVDNLNDTDASGINLDNLTDGSETTLHIHDGRYRTETELFSQDQHKGASFIGVYDGAGLTSTTNVENYLQENRTAIDAIEDNTITGSNGITSTGDVGSDNQIITADCDGTSIVNTEGGSSNQIGIKNDGVLEQHINWGTSGSGGEVSAGDIPVADAYNFWTTDDVETALNEIGLNTISGGDGITSSGKIGDNNQIISVDLGIDPGLEFTPVSGAKDKLEAKVHVATATKLTKDSDGLGIDESIRPVWTEVHRHRGYVRCEARLLVSGGETSTIGGIFFPLHIRTVDRDGRMLYAGGDTYQHHYACVGGHHYQESDFDTLFDKWAP